MSSREATEAITGYFYQFDKTILEILKCKNDSDIVWVEGIEDIDLTSDLEKTTIQCKYYAGSEYNHSVVKPAIIWMLKHFKENKCESMNYLLYGHYKSGQEKLGKISIEFVKLNFLTTKKTRKCADGTEEKYTERVHEDIQVSDLELQKFIDLLKIDLYAPSFDEQYESVIDAIKSALVVGQLEAELYHYSAALKKVRDLAVKELLQDRSISKKDFIAEIMPRDELFDAWFIRRKGREQYIRLVRSKQLCRELNTDPYERFFIMEASGVHKVEQLAEVAQRLSAKWGKLWAKSEKQSYCPSLFFYNVNEEVYGQLKNYLYRNNYKFVDGYPYRGSPLNVPSFYTQRTKQNEIKLRLADSLEDVVELVGKSEKVVEVYEFYTAQPMIRCSKIKVVQIKIESFDYIKDILK